MKVKELIKSLESLDEDLEVVVRDLKEDRDYQDLTAEEDSSNGQAAAVIVFYG